MNDAMMLILYTLSALFTEPAMANSLMNVKTALRMLKLR
jgi:hypothetical protein